MREGAERTRRFAEPYRGVPDPYEQEPSKLAITALSVFRENEVQMLLELGSGLGKNTWYFAENGIMVAALDSSEPNISVMQMTAKRECQEGMVTPMVHDATEQLPFPDGSFDAVYSDQLFNGELSKEKSQSVLEECRRVLRAGGINILAVDGDLDTGSQRTGRQDTRTSPEERIRELADGYEILKVKEIEDGPMPITSRSYEVILRKPR